MNLEGCPARGDTDRGTGRILLQYYSITMQVVMNVPDYKRRTSITVSRDLIEKKDLSKGLSKKKTYHCGLVCVRANLTYSIQFVYEMSAMLAALRAVGTHHNALTLTCRIPTERSSSTTSAAISTFAPQRRARRSVPLFMARLSDGFPQSPTSAATGAPSHTSIRACGLTPCCIWDAHGPSACSRYPKLRPSSSG